MEERGTFGELDPRYGLGPPVGCQVGSGRLAEIFVQHVPQGKVLGTGGTLFADGSVVVIAGEQGREFDDAGVVQRAAGKAEVGAAAEHIEIHGSAHFQSFLKVFCRRFDFLVQCIGTAPEEDAAHPGLPCHQGFPQVHGLKLFQVVQGAGARLGIHPIPVLFQNAVSVLEGIHPIGAEEGYVDTVCPVIIPQETEIFPVAAEGAVFVFQAEEDDASPVGIKMGPQYVAEYLIVILHMGHEGSVAGADAHGPILQEPGRKPTHVPFGTHIGGATHDHLQPHLFGGAKEKIQVTETLETELAFFGFVEIPGHVGGNGGDAKVLHQFHAALPAPRQGAEIMEVTAEHKEFFPVQINPVGANFNSIHKRSPFSYWNYPYSTKFSPPFQAPKFALLIPIYSLDIQQYP